jgi:hypothetical protein
MPKQYAPRVFGGPAPYTPIVPEVQPVGSPTIVVGGQARFCLAGSLSVQSKIGKRSNASCTLRTTTATHFEADQRIQIFDKDNTLIFNGYLDKPKEQKRGFKKFLVHTLTAVDGHRLADKRRVAKVYTNQSAGAMAYDIWYNILRFEGVTIGAIFDGPTPSQYLFPSETLYPGENVVASIPRAVFAYPKVSEAYDALAKQASYAGIPYWWQIDEQLRLWFVPYTYLRRGQVVTGDDLDEDTVTVTRHNPAYFNKKYVLDATVETDPQTETRKGDGETTSWEMIYPVVHPPEITVNGVAKTVGIGQLDKDKDFYWNGGSTTISQDSGGTKLLGPDDPGGPDILSVTYVGSYPTNFVQQDNAQVAYEQELDGSSGIVEDVEENATITTFEAGVNYVSEALARYSKQGLELDFQTQDSTYMQGQLATFNLPDFNLNNAELLVESVTASDQKDGLNIWYSVHAVMGPVDTTWVDFFSKLLATPQKVENISIGVSQVLNTLQTFTANVACSAILRVQSFGGLAPSETLYPANDLYPS